MLERSNDSAARAAGPVLARLAGAPISWGVCEVPGWGRMLPPEVVLADMRRLGLVATELGAEGWLPEDPGALTELLDRFGLRLVAAFVPLVLHDAEQASSARAAAEEAAWLLAAARAEVLVSAAVASVDWAPRRTLAADEWEHLVGMLGTVDEIAAEHGLRHALHPHVGTLVETAADVERVVEGSDVSLCLDTGHLVIGGADPVRLAREEPGRIGHVHLKDVDLSLAAEVRSGALSLREATLRGLFRPLGSGGVAVGEAVAALERAGYGGWYVLEQDVVLPEVGSADPSAEVAVSIEYVRALAGEAGS